MKYTLTLCPNPACLTRERGQPLPDVARWCCHCEGREVVLVEVDVSEEAIEKGERRGQRVGNHERRRS